MEHGAERFVFPVFYFTVLGLGLSFKVSWLRDLTSSVGVFHISTSENGTIQTLAKLSSVPGGYMYVRVEYMGLEVRACFSASVEKTGLWRKLDKQQENFPQGIYY